MTMNITSDKHALESGTHEYPWENAGFGKYTIRLFVLVLAVMMLQSMPLNKKTVQACGRSDSSHTLSPY